MAPTDSARLAAERLRQHHSIEGMDFRESPYFRIMDGHGIDQEAMTVDECAVRNWAIQQLSSQPESQAVRDLLELRHLLIRIMYLPRIHPEHSLLEECRSALNRTNHYEQE